MNFLKKYLFILIIFVCAQANGNDVQKILKSNNVPVRFLNGILLLEGGFNENAYKTIGPIGIDLVNAIQSKAAPIIVSGPVLHSFLYKRKKSILPNEVQELEKSIEDQKKRWKEINEIDRKLKDLNNKHDDLDKEWSKNIALRYDEHVIDEATYKDRIQNIKNQMDEIYIEISNGINRKNDLEDQLNADYGKKTHGLIDQYMSQKVNFDYDEWLIYKQTDSELFLLIPKVYNQKKQQELEALFSEKIKPALSRFNCTQAELSVGLKVDDSSRLTKIPSLEKLSEILAQKYEGIKARLLLKIPRDVFLKKYQINLNALKSMFIQSDSNESILGNWNLILSGHGLYSREKYAQDIEKIDPFHGWIAGITLSQLEDFLRFLTNDIQMASLYIWTCYSGGAHLDKINFYIDLIQKGKQNQKVSQSAASSINHDFLIINASIGDVVTNAELSYETLAIFKENRPYIPFDYYFDQINNFLRPALERSALDSYVEQHMNQLATILQEFSVPKEIQKSIYVDGKDFYGITNIPQVRLNAWKKFKPVASEDRIIFIDKEFLEKERKEFQEGKIAGIDVKNKEAVVLAVDNIDIPLNIFASEKEFLPAIISRTTPNALHVLERINCVEGKDKQTELVTLIRFLQESIFQLETVYNKVYNIKKIDCKNYSNSELVQLKEALMDSEAKLKITRENITLPIRNMWIHKSVTTQYIPKFAQLMSGTIIFELNNTYYMGKWDKKKLTIPKWKKISKKEFEAKISEMKKIVTQPITVPENNN